MPQHEAEHDDVHRIRDALKGLQFGEVRIVVQDGMVVQVERTERTRFEKRHRPDLGR